MRKQISKEKKKCQRQMVRVSHTTIDAGIVFSHKYFCWFKKSNHWFSQLQFSEICLHLYRSKWIRKIGNIYLSYLVWLLPGVGDGFMLRDNEPFGLDTLPIVFSWWWPPISDPANDKWEFLRGFFLFFIRFMNCFFRLRSELLFFFDFFNSVQTKVRACVYFEKQKRNEI